MQLSDFSDSSTHVGREEQGSRILLGKGKREQGFALVFSNLASLELTGHQKAGADGLISEPRALERTPEETQERLARSVWLELAVCWSNFLRSQS